MYEVDVVFKGSKNPREPIVEERTQILGLIFRVDLDYIVEETETKELDRRIVRARVGDYLASTISNAPGGSLTREKREAIMSISSSRSRSHASFHSLGCHNGAKSETGSRVRH